MQSNETPRSTFERIPESSRLCKYAIGRSEMLGKSPTLIRPPYQTLGHRVARPARKHKRAPPNMLKSPKKAIVPICAMSELSILVTILLNISDGRSTMIAMLLRFLVVSTDKMFLRDR